MRAMGLSFILRYDSSLKAYHIVIEPHPVIPAVRIVSPVELVCISHVASFLAPAELKVLVVLVLSGHRNVDHEWEVVLVVHILTAFALLPDDV